MRFSTKQLATFYFSLVAMAIVIIHVSVFSWTMESMELVYAENRMQNISDHINATDVLDDGIPAEGITLQTQGKAAFDPYVLVFSSEAALASELGITDPIPVGTTFELESATTHRTYFVYRARGVDNSPGYFVVLDNSFYEQTEELVFARHVNLLWFSLIVMLVSLVVIVMIARRLTNPVASLAAQLSGRSVAVLEPIVAPSGVVTRELDQLITSLNSYQSRIAALIDRERMFSRYASHELRTPLMVVQGAATLLDETVDDAFSQKQVQRIMSACNDMREFVQTLLGLSRQADMASLISRRLDREEIADILNDLQYLIENKPVAVELQFESAPEIRIPEPAFKMLIGNIIKNAMAHTESGHVTILVRSQQIQVRDSGVGLSGQSSHADGYGLGLLLVNDICRQYGCTFTLVENAEGGCSATIDITPHSGVLPSVAESP